MKKTAGLGVGAVAVAASIGGYVFSASNTVPDTKAGIGSGTITGYAVSNVQYTNSNGVITAVSFNLDGPARDVSVQLTSGGTWNDCGGSTGGGNLVNCSGLTEDAGTADQLSVVATQ
jgi:hypothetical protein